MARSYQCVPVQSVDKDSLYKYKDSPAQFAVKTTECKAGGCLVCAWPNLAQLVANAPVKLPSLYAQEVISRMYDATFSGDGSGSVDVVSCHHAHGDSSPLALPDGFRYLLRKVLCRKWRSQGDVSG